MITIIAGTNRKKSNSLNVAKSYKEAFEAKGLESQILNLADIPSCFVEDMYSNHSDEVKSIIEKYIISVKHFVFTIPEYNGTFSGALKLFMDGLDPAYFNHKSAMLAGVASGRAGNIVGLEQFTTVLNHLQVEVLSNKVLLSQIDNILGSNGLIEDEIALKIIDNQLNKFIKINSLK